MSEITPFSNSNETLDIRSFNTNVQTEPPSENNGLTFDDDEEDINIEEPYIEPFEYSPDTLDINILPEKSDAETIPFSNTDETGEVVKNIGGIFNFIGPNNQPINMFDYMAARQRDKKFLTGGIFGEAGTSGDISEYYFTRDLTKEDIVADPVLMEVVRDALKSRYSDTVVSKMYSAYSGALGATTGGLINRDYDNMPDEKVFEIYQNWMRLFTSGNSMTVANELTAAGLFANDEERAKIGAGYHLFERMDNAFVGRGTYAEMGDALFDYTRSFVFDPTVFLSFAVGKLLYGTAIKTKGQALNKTLTGFYKSQLMKGVGKEQARKQVARAVSKRQVALATASFAVPDLFFNLGLDIGIQSQLINVGNQEEISKFRLGITTLGSLAVPTIFGTTSFFVREARKNKLINDSYLSYFDIEKELKKGNKNVGQIIDDRVESNISEIINIMDRNFGNIKGDPSKLEAWKLAKQTSLEQLMKNKSDDPFEFDIQHTKEFFKNFFYGTVDDKGVIVTRGYLAALKEAGFVFHQDMIKKSKISGILGQTIKYLPNNVVKKYMKNYEEFTGKSLNLDYTANALSARYINTASESGGFQNISSRAVQMIMREVDNTNEGMKLVANEGEIEKSPLVRQFLLGTYKRLLTSHPATTGANLQGFAALSFLDSAAEMASSLIHLAQRGYYLKDAVMSSGGQLSVDKAIKHSNQAYANFFGAIRRNLSVLSPDMEVGYAKKILDLNPEMKAKLFRDIAGDGGPNDSLSMFNLDKGGMFVKGADAVTKGFQTVALVRMQDEYTKLWAFGNNVNKFIIAEYGVSPTKFFQREDIGVEIITPRFKENVLEKAKFQTLRQTASVNWTQLKKMYGNNFFRSVARGYENITNKYETGYIVPFGSFNNTVIATFADFTGLQFLRQTVQLARGKKLDPESQDIVDSAAKAAIGYTFVFYRLFEGQNSALNKVAEGRNFNENLTPEGEVSDMKFAWPQNQFDLTAQILAHGLSGDGRDVRKDIEGLTVPETVEYLKNNFNSENIPKELLLELGLSVGLSAVRDVDRVISYVNKELSELAKTGDPSAFVWELMGAAASRISQGATRPLEPYNMVANLFRFEGKVPDLKQGNAKFNSATKYINSLLPLDLSPMNIEGKATLLQGTDVTPNVSKMMFGARRVPPYSVGTLMLNSVGKKDYHVTDWNGDPQIKNTMNALAAPIFEQIAVKTLQEHKNFFRYDLEVKLSILKEMQSELRKRTEQALIDFAPKSFQLMRDFTENANKDKIDKILGSLIEGGQLEEGTTLNDILNMEDYESIIYQMQFLLDNYEEIFIQPRFQ